MDRRHFLRSFAATGVAAGTTATAGCAGVLGNSGAEGTVLGPPEQTRGDPVHPIHGDEMPEFTVPDPITGKRYRPNSSRANARSCGLRFTPTAPTASVQR